MKKKLFALALATTAVLTFAACGSKDNTGSSSASGSGSAVTESSSSAAQDSDSMSLADWLTTDDAKAAEDSTNSALASTGMSVKLNADGNWFVYEYYLPDGTDYSSLTADALDAAFGPVIEENESQMKDLFSSFESEYSIKLDGVRFKFLTSDGSEIYSGDVANE